MPKPAPFSITPDAEDYIRSCLGEMPPKADPTIFMATELSETLDSRGEKTRRWYEGENFIVGDAHDLEQSEMPQTERIELLGHNVSIASEALKRLSGQTLVLRRVNAPYGFINIPQYVLVTDSTPGATAHSLDTEEKIKRNLSIGALTILGGFSGMGVIWIAICVVVPLLKLPEDKFLPLIFPSLIVGWIISAIVSFLFFRSVFKTRGRTKFVQEQREEKYIGYGGLEARLDWCIFLGIPAPLTAILIFVLESFAHTDGQKAGVAVGVLMVVFGASMYFCDRIPRRLVFWLGIFGWMLTFAFGYWFFRFGPESHPW